MQIAEAWLPFLQIGSELQLIYERQIDLLNKCGMSDSTMLPLIIRNMGESSSNNMAFCHDI